MTCDTNECWKQLKAIDLCKIHTSVFKKQTEFRTTEIWTKFLIVFFSLGACFYIFFQDLDNIQKSPKTTRNEPERKPFWKHSLVYDVFDIVVHTAIISIFVRFNMKSHLKDEKLVRATQT